jgi:hypothetical protein
LAYAAPATNPITTEGDLVIGDASGDAVRLPIGALGTVLTSDGDTADWAALAAGGGNFTLVNAGGTTLSGSSVTISGITGADKLFVLIDDLRTGSIYGEIRLQLSGDTGSNYFSAGQYVRSEATYQTTNLGPSTSYAASPGTAIPIMQLGNDAINTGFAGITIQGGNSSGVKPYISNAGTNGVNNYALNIQGYWDSSSTISSVTVLTNAGNFNQGTIYVFKSA